MGRICHHNRNDRIGLDLRRRRFECCEIGLASGRESIAALQRFGQAERLEPADPELVRATLLAGLRRELCRHNTWQPLNLPQRAVGPGLLGRAIHPVKSCAQRRDICGSELD